MTNTELILKIKAEIERRITDNTFGAKLELIDILAWLDTLESEEPMNPDDAMKELDEKIALVKQRGTWDGVDVDKYMDEVRGREPEKPVPNDLEEAAENYRRKSYNAAMIPSVDGPINEYGGSVKEAFIAGAEWQEKQDLKSMAEIYKNGYNLCKEQMMKEAVECVVCAGMEGDKWIMTYIGSYESMLKTCKAGDKVRVIVLPKED